MAIQSWLKYLGLVIIATGTPGPAVLFNTTNSLLHGRRKSVFVAFGNIVGLFCLGLIAISGLGAVLKTSAFLFAIVKYAGAAYLVYLGVKLITQRHFDATTVDKYLNEKEISLYAHLASDVIYALALGVCARWRNSGDKSL